MKTRVEFADIDVVIEVEDRPEGMISFVVRGQGIAVRGRIHAIDAQLVAAMFVGAAQSATKETGEP